MSANVNISVARAEALVLIALLEEHAYSLAKAAETSADKATAQRLYQIAQRIEKELAE